MLGVLELAGRGAGFLRRREAGYLPSNGDVHVGERIIRQYGLRTGDEIVGETRPGGRGRGPTLERVTAFNGRPPDQLRGRPEFSRLSAIHPNELIRLETRLIRSGQPDHTNRVIDLLSPLGKGQRALIVAPAKAGKTMVLQAIAEGVSANYPEADLLILLVDERPEEVFEMEAAGVGEVVASSFDNPATQHVALAELTLERARRRVELGQDVVMIVDSLTRLARAYNTVEKGTGLFATKPRINNNRKRVCVVVVNRLLQIRRCSNAVTDYVQIPEHRLEQNRLKAHLRITGCLPDYLLILVV